MIVTKMAFINIQTLRQTISKSLQFTLHYADANALQTLCKLFPNALQTPFKRFPNPFKAFQTFSKPFTNAVSRHLKHHLAQIVMFDKTRFPMEGQKC